MTTRNKIRNITGNKYTDFVLTNWKDVHSLYEMVDDAKEKFGPWMKGQIQDALLDMRDSYFEPEGIRFHSEWEEDDDLPWWDVGRFDPEASAGPHMFMTCADCENVWDVLLKRKDVDDLPALLMDVAFSPRTKKARQRTAQTKWLAHLTRHKKRFKANGIEVLEFETGDDVLEYSCAWQYLDKVFTQALITDPPAFRKAFVAAVVKFTKIMRPIIKNGPPI